jgi:hypothetical protein
MTERQATALMKAYRNGNKPENDIQRRWRDVIVRAGKAQADLNFLKLDRQTLLDLVEPQILSTILKAGQAMIQLYDGLKKIIPGTEPADNTADEFDTVP